MDTLLLEYLKKQSFYEGKTEGIYDIEDGLLFNTSQKGLDAIFTLFDNQSDLSKDEKYLSINTKLVDKTLKEIFKDEIDPEDKNKIIDYLAANNTKFIAKQYEYMFPAYKKMGTIAKLLELQKTSNTNSCIYSLLGYIANDETFKLVMDIEGDTYIIDEICRDTYFVRGEGLLLEMAPELSQRYDEETKEIARGKALRKHR